MQARLQRVKGELPCHKIYEDELTIAFLTIGPMIEGHTLVVPKKQVDDFEKLPDEDYQSLFQTVKLVSNRIKEVYGSKKAIINIMGFEVPHAHVHIMPANSEEEYFNAIENRHNLPKPSNDQLISVAERLKF